LLSGTILLCTIIRIALAFLLAAQQGQSLCCQFLFRAETFTQDKKKLIDVLTQPVQIAQATFEADGAVDRQEIGYLLAMQAGDIAHGADIARSLTRLMQKKSCVEIELHINQEEGAGSALHFILRSGWTLHKVKIHGIYRGSDIYRRCYLIEQGDIFDHAQHRLSLDKINELLRAQGYFSAHVSDSCIYCPITKTVTVHLTITQNERFLIRSLNVVCCPSSYLDQLLAAQTQNFKALHGAYFDKQLLSRQAASLKEWLAQEGFLQPEVMLEQHVFKKKHAVDVVWRITLGQRRCFSFSGNVTFSDADLLSHLQHFSRSLLLIPPAILSQELIQLYRAAGFLGVTIDVQEKEGLTSFSINEDIRATLSSIVMHNVFFFDAYQLTKSCFGELGKNAPPQDHLIQEGTALLIDQYVKAGFFDAKVLACKLVPIDQTASTYQLDVTVDEGPRYEVASCIVQDYPELAAVLDTLSAPEYATAEFFARQEQTIRTYFTTHMQQEVRLTCERMPQGQKVAIVWHVQLPACKTIFGKTIVVANDKHPFSYVMKTCAYQEGEVWDQEKIKNTFLALKDLAIFDSITITPACHDTSAGVRDVLIRLQLDDPCEVRLRAGIELQHVKKYQTLAGLAYRVGGTFMVKNPGKVGDCLTFDADVGRFHHEFVAKYRYPWPFNWPVRATVQAYATFYDQPTFVGSRTNIYGIRQRGVLVSFDRLYKGATLNFTGGVEQELTGVTALVEKNRARAILLAHAINFEPTLLGKEIPYCFLQPSLFFDRLDNKLNPTIGFYSLCSAKLMIPLRADRMRTFLMKILAEHAFFVPLYKAVFGLRARVGHIFYRTFSAISPAERFYLGGSHSLRGYDMDLAPPLGLFVDGDETMIVPRGGKSMANINVELRVPLYADIDGVVFNDLGVLGGDHRAFVLAEGLLGSSGFGIRFRTPVGPLRFDIGWKWHKHDPAEPGYAWFLSLGQSF